MYVSRPTKAEIQARLAAGASLTQLAREYGCGRTTMTRWSHADTITSGNRKGNGYRHPVCLLPCLQAKMEAAGATLESLAQVSGVSTGPINRARHGIPIRLTLALILYETLNTRQFRRKGGPRFWTDKARRNILKAKGIAI